MGRDIGQQILAQPKALLIGGCIALGMGLIPGMPTTVFVVLAVPLIGIGLAMRPQKQVNAITGEVTETNPALEEDPALVNSAPEDGGWFFKMTIADVGELDGLMDEDGYKAFLEEL